MFTIFKDYYEYKLEWFYIGWALCIVAYFLIRGISKAHIHHYVLALIIISLLGYQCYTMTLIQAVFCGVFIEGSSRWGLDPIWGGDNEAVQQNQYFSGLSYASTT